MTLQMISKKWLGFIAALFFSSILTFCSSCTQEITGPNISQHVILTTRAISIYKNYGNVENIIKKYSELFTEDEIQKLAKVNNEFKDIYYTISKISSDAESLQKVLVSATVFDELYSSLKLQYITSRYIIFNHISEFDSQDRAMILMFDSNAKAIDKGVTSLRNRMLNNNINEADITLLLSEIVTFVNSINILLNTM